MNNEWTWKIPTDNMEAISIICLDFIINIMCTITVIIDLTVSQWLSEPADKTSAPDYDSIFIPLH